jgi:hypothetical protein
MMSAATLSKPARAELLAALSERYAQATRKDKSTVLNEFVALTGCHRKHAIRLLTAGPRSGPGVGASSRTIYDRAVRDALIVLWEAADRICGKRLKAALPSLVSALERHGHLSLDPIVRERVLAVSPATIDRLLAPVRKPSSGRTKRSRRTKPSQQVPVRTFADWTDPLPGYLEIDFVSHGGSSMQGSFLWSLVATDVCSGWTEVLALVAREQSLVIEGLETIRRRLPVPLRGIDSDNDSAFLNDSLLKYCREQGIEFTRSRAYRKNDQAWIEQKNGAVVRRFVGYERYAGAVAGQCLGQLHQAVRLFVNYFQPSFQLKSKTRDGARVSKKYHNPATPCDRLLDHPAVSAEAKAAMRAERDRLDPLRLLHRARECQSALAAGDPGRGPGRENLEAFLGKLADLWRSGEARPTHRSKPPSPRTYRTRVDPFTGAWSEILGWLQAEPDATGRVLLDRLQAKYPDRFPDAQLRTLQRRVKDWRQMMARELVQGTAGSVGHVFGSIEPEEEGAKTGHEKVGCGVEDR